MNLKENQKSLHDKMIYTLKDIYEGKGKTVSINTADKKEENYKGYHFDMIIKDTPDDKKPILIEVETGNSVSKEEAKEQWKKYDNAGETWYLDVPQENAIEAQRIIKRYSLENCKIIKWGYINELPGI